MKLWCLILTLLFTTTANANLIRYSFFANLPFDEADVVTAGVGHLEIDTDLNTISTWADILLIDQVNDETFESEYDLTGSYEEVEELFILRALNFSVNYVGPVVTISMNSPTAFMDLTRFPTDPFEELSLFDTELGLLGSGSWVTEDPVVVPEWATIALLSVGAILLLMPRLPKRRL